MKTCDTIRVPRAIGLWLMLLLLGATGSRLSADQFVPILEWLTLQQVNEREGTLLAPYELNTPQSQIQLLGEFSSNYVQTWYPAIDSSRGVIYVSEIQNGPYSGGAGDIAVVDLKTLAVRRRMTIQSGEETHDAIGSCTRSGGGCYQGVRCAARSDAPSGTCAYFTGFVPPAGGTRVTVTAPEASITFDSVSAAGSTTITPKSLDGIDVALPGQFSIDGSLLYEVSTSATTAGPITLCFSAAHVEAPRRSRLCMCCTLRTASGWIEPSPGTLRPRPSARKRAH